MSVIVVNYTANEPPESFLRTWTDNVIRELDARGVEGLAPEKELVLVFVGKERMQQLNLEFRHKDKPTDVLSFEGTDGHSFGELVLCPDIIQNQAQEHDLSYEHELGYLVLHGMLHLLGYEHEQGGRRARRMFKLQDEIFDALVDSR